MRQRASGLHLRRMSRMPERVTWCGVIAPPISTLTSAAVLAAASQPSMSSEGSASAIPRACISAMASSSGTPRSICERMYWQVVLTTPRKPFDEHGRHRLANEVEDRHAIHHRAFEEEDAIDRLGQGLRARRRRTPPAPCWWSRRARGLRAMTARAPWQARRRSMSRTVVSITTRRPSRASSASASVTWRMTSMPLLSLGRDRPAERCDSPSQWPEAPPRDRSLGLDDASMAARGNRDEPPVEIEPVGCLVEQPQKSPRRRCRIRRARGRARDRAWC